MSDISVQSEQSAEEPVDDRTMMLEIVRVLRGDTVAEMLQVATDEELETFCRSLKKTCDLLGEKFPGHLPGEAEEPEEEDALAEGDEADGEPGGDSPLEHNAVHTRISTEDLQAEAERYGREHPEHADLSAQADDSASVAGEEIVIGDEPDDYKGQSAGGSPSSPASPSRPSPSASSPASSPASPSSGPAATPAAQPQPATARRPSPAASGGGASAAVSAASEAGDTVEAALHEAGRPQAAPARPAAPEEASGDGQERRKLLMGEIMKLLRKSTMMLDQASIEELEAFAFSLKSNLTRLDVGRQKKARPSAGAQARPQAAPVASGEPEARPRPVAARPAAKPTAAPQGHAQGGHAPQGHAPQGHGQGGQQPRPTARKPQAAPPSARPSAAPGQPAPKASGQAASSQGQSAGQRPAQGGAAQGGDRQRGQRPGQGVGSSTRPLKW